MHPEAWWRWGRLLGEEKAGLAGEEFNFEQTKYFL